MNKSAALFRASNVITLDYSLEAALISALAICDEAIIVVDMNSRDDTVNLVYAYEVRDWFGRITVVEKEWEFDRMWQERCWNWAAEATDAEWLMFHDADEAIHEDHALHIRAMMTRPNVNLIRFPFIHLYATPNYMAHFQLRYNTRLGRRSVGYRMRNWCTDEQPRRAVCQMVYGEEEYNAHLPTAEGVETIAKTFVMHYGWCRSAQALAISQRKHSAWYADGGGMEDGRIPQLAPRDFKLAHHLETGFVTRYKGQHPAGMESWFERHADEWEALNE